MFSEYYNIQEWFLAAILAVFPLWPCVFYYRGKTSTIVGSIVVGLHLAPCYWLTLFDPNWNGWVPSARVTYMFLMDGLFGDGDVDFYLQPSWWISIVVTAFVAFIVFNRVKREVKRERELVETQGLPPVF